MVGRALFAQGQITAAEPHLIAGYEGLKQRLDRIPSTRKYAFTQSLQRLDRLYTALDKPDEAAKWRRLLDTYKSAGRIGDSPNDLFAGVWSGSYRNTVGRQVRRP